MGLAKDFRKFSTPGYLREHYKDFSREERFSLWFLHEAYREYGKKGLTILELGGGPTIYQLMSASGYAKEIIFTDFLPKNLQTVKEWVAGKRSVIDWKERFQVVADLEGTRGIRALEQRLRSKLNDFRVVDILGPRSPFRNRTFDVVSSHFCADSITNKKSDFLKAVRFITGHVRPGGLLLMSFLKHTRSYVVGRRRFVSYSLDEKEVRHELQARGFRDIELYTVDVENAGTPNANIFARALKKDHASRR